jgi:hypothetical protein
MIIRVLDNFLLPWRPHQSALPVSSGRVDHEGTVNSLNVLGVILLRPATGAWIVRLCFMATLQATLAAPLSLEPIKNELYKFTAV